jgi:UDP-N-acetylglucosamine 2-epimerase (non-hydrolysing)/UDP-GlcNAc3NAcA epimerase
VKAAAVSTRLRARHEEVLLHSGQHYDDELSAVFFRELDLPAPDRELGIGSGTNAEQITGIMQAFQSIVPELDASAVLVYGDTNTTLAGALSAAQLDLPLIHVEAGMRSFDGSMPEERNRVITDHLSELLLCSTAQAVENLAVEGIDNGARLVGDVMADVTLTALPIAETGSDALERFDLVAGSFLLVTAHRAGNVDSDGALSSLVGVLEALPMPAVFPIHPRTRRRLEGTGGLGRLEAAGQLILTPPLGYLDFLKLLSNSAAVLTDSGGIQKEAYLVAVPCITLRDTTEWVETVELGWNRLVGLDRGRVLEALRDLEPPATHPELYGGGHAGERVVEAIGEWASAHGVAT